MTLCYHQPCDSIRKPYDADFANLEFYKHLVQTLLNSVLELSKASCLRAEHLNRFYDRLDEKENTNEKIDNSGCCARVELLIVGFSTLFLW